MAQPGRLIGRERELREISGQLLQDDVRLLTLLGPAGAGKTRLALALAGGVLPHFPDGTFFVDLTAIAEPRLVIPTIAQIVGVEDIGVQSLELSLQLYLGPRKMLLILDNFEHVTPAAVQISSLLQACPILQILVTSRSTLHLAWERTFVLEGVAVPAAMELFSDRAKAASADFQLDESNSADVAELCARLDGLPLALELAAARSNVLTPAVMVRRLNRPLDLLVQGAVDKPSRHSSLKTALEWSYTLLSEAEARFFRRLTVFAGGWTLEAAEQVAAFDSPVATTLDLLASLVAKSLVQVTRLAGDTRYRLLETVHEFAAEKLAQSGELRAMKARHLSWCLGVARNAAAGWDGAEQRRWLDRLEQELANIRRAIATAQEGPDAIEAAIELAATLWFFWDVRGYLGEGGAYLLVLLGRHPNAARPVLARAKWAAGYLLVARGDIATSRQLLQEAASQYERIGDDQGRARSLSALAVADTMAGLASAEQQARSALAISRRVGGATLRRSLHAAGVTAMVAGKLEEAKALFVELMEACKQPGDQWGACHAGHGLGRTVLLLGDVDGAAEHLSAGLRAAQGLKDKRNMSHCLEALGWVAALQERPEKAARLLAGAEALPEAIGTPLQPPSVSDHEKYLAVVRGALQPADFEQLWAAARLMPLEALIEEQPAAESHHAPRQQDAAGLTERELEVLRLLASGHSNQEIADVLVLSSLTVGRHISNIYVKIGVHRRSEATAYALRHNVVD